ncbi:MAG: sodium:proton antiporter [Micrococcaceae bacterium]
MSIAVLLITVIFSLMITSISRNWKVHSGLVTVAFASAISFIPGVTHIEVEPEVILSLVMPPLLYSAALGFPFTTFFKNLKPILGMGVGLVVVTCLVITYLVPIINPAISTLGAFVLASVIAPPDTVTMVSEENSEGVPHRIVSILKGESLVNDATSLVLFSVAVSMLTNEENFIGQPVIYFIYSCIVGILVGLVLGWCLSFIRGKLEKPSLEIALNILMPFVAYQISEYFHASGVLAVVTTAFVVAFNMAFNPKAMSDTTYKTRLIETNVWPVIDLLIESFLFAYIGLQAHYMILEVRTETGSLRMSLLFAAVITLIVVAVRAIYSFLLFSGWRARNKRITNIAENTDSLSVSNGMVYSEHHAPKILPPSLGWKDSLLVSWMGMRGIVTLAAAASIPLAGQNGAENQAVTLIQFTAFTVAIGTLLVQGLTLPLLVKYLDLDLTEDEERKEYDMQVIQEAFHEMDSHHEHPSFDKARQLITHCLVNQELSEEAARAALNRIDLQQAALEARKDIALSFDKAFSREYRAKIIREKQAKKAKVYQEHREQKYLDRIERHHRE